MTCEQIKAQVESGALLNPMHVCTLLLEKIDDLKGILDFISRQKCPTPTEWNLILALIEVVQRKKL